jgi:hypothetical protein
MGIYWSTIPDIASDHERAEPKPRNALDHLPDRRWLLVERCHRRETMIPYQVGRPAVVGPGGEAGLRQGIGGVASGSAASCISSSTLSSAAVRFIRSRPQRVQR